MIDCLDCGVVQGSKLSGLLYTIYTNEVPILQEILTNEEVCNTMRAKFYEELPVKLRFSCRERMLLGALLFAMVSPTPLFRGTQSGGANVPRLRSQSRNQVCHVDFQ